MSNVKIAKCAYLGCEKEGTILDDVEVAPGVLEKQMVCKEHVGQLVGNITLKSRVNR